MSKATSPQSSPQADTTLSDLEHQCDEPLLMTVDEVADKLRLKPWSVYQLCDSGRLPSVYLGFKSRRIKPSDLRAYVDSLPSERPTALNAELNSA